MSLQTQDIITPDSALGKPKAGDFRFVRDQRLNRNLLEQAKNTSDGQHPFAVDLSNIDSHTSAELIFDQGIGDIFSVRIAGNIIDDDILGNLEFACKFAGSKLIVVPGHTRYGAIQGAYNNVKAGKLTGLLSKIKPAIENIKVKHEPDTKYKLISNDIIRENVLGIRRIKSNSAILSELIENEEINIVGGIHNLSNGEVRFFSTN